MVLPQNFGEAGKVIETAELGVRGGLNLLACVVTDRERRRDVGHTDFRNQREPFQKRETLPIDRADDEFVSNPHVSKR